MYYYKEFYAKLRKRNKVLEVFKEKTKHIKEIDCMSKHVCVFLIKTTIIDRVEHYHHIWQLYRFKV